jgi:2,3-bisphosphoglycerate-independent phosphoglycerate mutase
MDKIFSFYQKNITDEFLPPLVKEGYEGVSKNDSIIFLNFRKDRAIQISQKVSDRNFENFYTMTNYSEEIKSHVIFENKIPQNILGDILEKNNKTQLRISETEKYAHVTYFFDGGIKKNHEGKKEILVNSPNVKTYDLQPEMSSKKLTQKIIEEINIEDKKDFIVINYPNVDMVAHTGNIEATIKAIEVVDRMVAEVISEGLKNNYTIMLAADHGNAEEISKTNRSHTKNKIPFTLISSEFENKKDEQKYSILKEGEFGLGNIAATILEIMGIKKEEGMEESLLKK